MKKTLKQTLILAVMVLCMLALFTVATSAATYADDATAIAGNAVARIGAEGTGTYYDSVSAAVEAVPEGGTDSTVITLIKDATWSSPTEISGKAVTIQGVNNNIALSLANGCALESNSSLTFDTLKISVDGTHNSNNTVYLQGSAIKLRFINCEITSNIAAESNFVRAISVSVDTLEFKNVKFFGAKFDLIAVGAGGTTVLGSTTTPVLFENVVGDFSNMVYLASGANPIIHLKVIGSTVTGNVHSFDGTTVCDDTFAKKSGYTHRIGDEVGMLGKVYFKTAADALLRADKDVKVYDITGTAPSEVTKACNHDYTKTVVPPKCAVRGYTDYKCKNCTANFQEDYVEALEHEYSEATCTAKAKCAVCDEEKGELAAHTKSAKATCTKKAVCSVCNQEFGELARHTYSVATCTKKSTCSGCGAERGELAKHVDTDNNKKCDKCGTEIAADEVKIDDPASEEKKGCKGTVGVAGLALVAALGSCALFVEKKRK